VMRFRGFQISIRYSLRFCVRVWSVRRATGGCT